MPAELWTESTMYMACYIHQISNYIILSLNYLKLLSKVHINMNNLIDNFYCELYIIK